MRQLHPAPLATVAGLAPCRLVYTRCRDGVLGGSGGPRGRMPGGKGPRAAPTTGELSCPR